MSSDIELYEKQADQYEIIQHLRPDYQKAEEASLELAVHHIPCAVVDVVDFCGGNGSFLYKLSQKAPVSDALIIDINKLFLQLAEARSWGKTNIRTLQSDILMAEITCTFDYVLSIFAYHHVPDGKKLSYLKKAFNALRDEGRMILTEIYLPSLDVTRAYYEKLLSEIPRNQRSKELEIFLRQTAQSTQSEFKVGKHFADDQIEKVGFQVIEERKIWPLDNTFSKDVGTFVTVLEKNSLTK